MAMVETMHIDQQFTSRFIATSRLCLESCYFASNFEGRGECSDRRLSGDTVTLVPLSAICQFGSPIPYQHL